MHEQIPRHAKFEIDVPAAKIPPIDADVPDQFAGVLDFRDVNERRAVRQRVIAPIPHLVVVVDRVARPVSLLPKKIDDFLANRLRINAFKLERHYILASS